MSTKRIPTYDLSEIQRSVAAGQYRVTRSALDGASALGMDESDVVACVLGLTRANFYKSMEAGKAPGLWQDVYRPNYQGEALYVKLQVAVPGAAVVISFKEL